MAAPVVFNLSPALPEDPLLRKQHLEDLITDIHGSFTFMQVKSEMFDFPPAGLLPFYNGLSLSGLCSGRRTLVHQEPLRAKETIVSLCSR